MCERFCYSGLGCIKVIGDIKRRIVSPFSLFPKTWLPNLSFILQDFFFFDM